MSKHLGTDGELSLRHLPDLSDDSFSFQIPAVSKRDLLLADNGDDFLKNAVDDSFMLPGPSRQPRPTQSSPSPPPTDTALTLNDLTPKPKSTRALVSRLKVSSVPTEPSMPEQEPPEWDTPSEAPLTVTPRTKAKRTLSQRRPEPQSKQRTPHGIARAAKPRTATRPATVKSKNTRLLVEDDEGRRHVEASPAIARLRALKVDVEMLNDDVDIDIGVGNDDNDVPCSLPNTLPREFTVPSGLGSTINVDNVRSDTASRVTNGTSVPSKPSFLTQVAISNTGTSEPCAAITSSLTLSLPISTPPDPCDDLHNDISAPTFRQQHSRALELEPTDFTHATPASSENAELINGQDSLDVSICSTTSGGVAERLVMYGQKMLMDSFVAFPAPGVGKIKQSSQNVNPDDQSASNLEAVIHNSKRNPGTRSPADGQERDNDDTSDKSQPFTLSQLSPHKQVKPVMASLSSATTASGTTSSNNNMNISIPPRAGTLDPLLSSTAYRGPSGEDTRAMSDLARRSSTKRPVSAAERVRNADGQSKHSSSFDALSAKDDPRPAKRLRAHPVSTDAVRIGDNDWKDDNGVSRRPGAAGRQNSARSSSKSVRNEDKGKATRTTRLAESSISAESKSAGVAKTRAKPDSKKQARTNAAGSVASSSTSSIVGSRLRSGSGSGSGAGSGSGTITRVGAGAGTRPERVAIFMSSSGKSDPIDVALKGEGHRNIFGGRTTQTELHSTDEKLASEDAHSDQVQANSDRSCAADADHDKADGRDKWELVPGPCLGSSPVSADEGGSGSPVDGVRCAHDHRVLKDAGSTPACGHVSAGVAGDSDPGSGTRAELGGPVGIESRARSGPGSSTSPSAGPRIDKTETVDAVGKLSMPSAGTNTEGRKELRGIRDTCRPEEGKKQRSHPHPAIVVENGTANQVANAKSLRAMKNTPLETSAKPRAPNRLEHSQSHKRTLSSSSSSQGQARRQRGRDHHTNAPESAQSAGPARSTLSSDATASVSASASASTATKPVGFKFEVDARMEARKVEFEKRRQERERQRQQERGTATLAKSYPVPDWKSKSSALGASLPAFASSSSYASTSRGSGKENALAGVVHAEPVMLHTELRMRERRKFDEQVREREQEMERVREEQRREREREEEREVREMRRRAVPRAHEVPEWYKDAPRRTRSGSGEALDG